MTKPEQPQDSWADTTGRLEASGHGPLPTVLMGTFSFRLLGGLCSPTAAPLRRKAALAEPVPG